MKRFNKTIKALVIGFTLTGAAFSAHASVESTLHLQPSTASTAKLSVKSDNIFAPAIPGEFKSVTSATASPSEGTQVAGVYVPECTVINACWPDYCPRRVCW